MTEPKEMTQQMMFLMDFPDEIILLILQDLMLLEALLLLQCNSVLYPPRVIPYGIHGMEGGG